MDGGARYRMPSQDATPGLIPTLSAPITRVQHPVRVVSLDRPSRWHRRSPPDFARPIPPWPAAGQGVSLDRVDPTGRGCVRKQGGSKYGRRETGNSGSKPTFNGDQRGGFLNRSMSVAGSSCGIAPASWLQGWQIIVWEGSGASL